MGDSECTGAPQLKVSPKSNRCIDLVLRCNELQCPLTVGFDLDRGSTLVCWSAFYWGMDASSHGTVCLQLKITMSTSSLYVHPLQLQYI
jgi:hypothetical protein